MALRSSDLCTLADVAGRLGITTPGAFDTRMTDAIQATSDLIPRFLGRDPLEYKAGIIEQLAAHGTLELMVQRPPIWNLTSIALDGALLTSDMYECLDKDLEIGAITLISGALWTSGLDDGGVGRNRVVGHERRRYTVTYDGGFVTANTSPVPNPNTWPLPKPIFLAAVRAAIFFFLNDATDASLTSEKLQSYAWTRAQASIGESGLPVAVEQMLQGYKFAEFA